MNWLKWVFCRNKKNTCLHIHMYCFFFITAVYCPQDSVGIFTNTATYPPGPYNLTEEIPLSCSVAGQTFSWSRYCVYNRLTDTYELQGSPYDCGSKYTKKLFAYLPCLLITFQALQTVWIQIRPYKMSGLIWIQTV